MSSKSTTDKFTVLNKLLNGDHILIHINTKNTNLIIPEKLKDGPSVTLKISRNFNGRLELKKDLIITDLLFNGQYFECKIPLSSIWGCVSDAGENFIWQDAIFELENFQSSLEKSLKESEGQKDLTQENKHTTNDKPKPTLKRIK